MVLANATSFYRKSGVAQWRDLRFFPPDLKDGLGLLPRPAPPAEINTHFPPTTTGFMMHKARFNSRHDTMREPLQP
jgi:hypothetical protein